MSVDGLGTRGAENLFNGATIEQADPASAEPLHDGAGQPAVTGRAVATMDAVDVPSGPGRAPGAVADSAPGRQRGVWRRYALRLALLLPAAVLAAAIGPAMNTH